MEIIQNIHISKSFIINAIDYKKDSYFGTTENVLQSLEIRV